MLSERQPGERVRHVHVDSAVCSLHKVTCQRLLDVLQAADAIKRHADVVRIHHVAGNNL